jgi:HEPN domain-containing protein
MNKQEKIEYWLDISDYDFETAKSMLSSSRYLYVVFMCQQAIEKIIKALYIHKFDTDPPKSHNLAFIFQMLGIQASAEVSSFLNLLSAHYIQNRYPDYKSRLSTTLSKDKAEQYLKKTEDIYKWLKSLIV